MVCPAHAPFDRLVHVAPGEVHILPDLHENDRHARILADGHVPAGGEPVVLDQLAQHLASERGFLRLKALLEQREHVVPDLAAGAQKQPVYGFLHTGHVDLSHRMSSHHAFSSHDTAIRPGFQLFQKID